MPKADFLAWLAAAPSPWHAAAEAERRLVESGFRVLDETEPVWSPEPGRGHLVRRGAALVAWIQPRAASGRPILGLAHTDSPCLRIRPRPEIPSCGCRRWSVETYGGLLNHSWLDRELEVAGRVAVQQRDGRVAERLVRLASPRPVIPSLAIHLDRGVNERGLVVDRQRHLPVLAGLLEGEDDSPLAGHLAAALAVAPRDILAWDLCLSDAVPPALAGSDDLVLSGRLDNLASCHALLGALVDLLPGPRADLPVVALLDGEEVGSGVPEGADGAFLPRILERVALSLGLDRAGFLGFLARGFALSCDMAHAVHPNHPERHEPGHAPLLGGGPVAKWNAGLRYASAAGSLARLQLAARRAGVPLQTFAMRADLACGSTVGPIVSSLLGLEAVDCGAPMLAMHSARECMAWVDQAASRELYREVLAGV